MAPTFREDPYGAYNFQVIVNGVSDDGGAVKGAFMECAGLEVELAPIDYRTGTEDIHVRKLPGLKKFPNITLKRGIIGDVAFWNWILDGLNGQVQRKEGSILLLDENRQEVMRWNFKRAWPCKWTGPAMKAAANEIATEALEICHEGIEIDQ
jgi:phage tail-like protein